MVGIVVISHSKALAEAVCSLAKQASAGARIIGVGGTGENGEEFGTDAVAIMEAIQQVYSDDGVLLLMDMGSALLSAQTALELLEENVAEKVKMCSAPVVEGAIVAAVQSNIGANLEVLCKEVLASLEPKQEQVKDIIEPTAPVEQQHSEKVPSGARSREYIIRNKHGLHARPAAKFVQAASLYDGEIYVAIKSNPTQVASASSLNSIAKLNIRQNDTIIVHVHGNKAEQFFDELETLVLSEFGEKPIEEQERKFLKQEEAGKIITEQQKETPQLLRISRGIAIGKAWKVDQTMTPNFLRKKAELAKKELKILSSLLDKARETLGETIEIQEEENTRAILEMHKTMMDDPDLFEKAKTLIEHEKCNAEEAWWRSCKTLSEEYQAIEDNAYLQARAVDCIDIGISVLAESKFVVFPQLKSAPENAILFIEEISPNTITKINLNTLKGIVTRYGGSTSHAAIIARSHNIPMFSGFANLHEVKENSTVLMDVAAAKLVLNPDEAILAEYREKQKQLLQIKQELSKKAREEAHTKDGKKIICVANIGSRLEIDKLPEYGAEGIGLFRSEFLFLNRPAPPSEEEQYYAYIHAAKTFVGNSVVIRLLDIGADKQLPYLSLPQENNPFLGVRGVRFDIAYTQLLLPQLRAILRAAVLGNISIMIPMVVEPQEIRSIKKMLEQARKELEDKASDCGRKLPVGIMIETPASVVYAEELAKESDFFSIGTNDLIQYTVAVERESVALAKLYDVCHPAVLRMLKQVTSAAQKTKTALSVCGEAGSDFEALPILLGMGIEKISAIPSRIPALKHLIQRLTLKDCQELVSQLWDFTDAAEVRRHVRSRFSEVELLSSMF